jgi:hypothetical protein
LKARTRRFGKFLQDFTAIEQFANRAYHTLLEELIRSKAGKAFVDG